MAIDQSLIHFVLARFHTIRNKWLLGWTGEPRLQLLHRALSLRHHTFDITRLCILCFHLLFEADVGLEEVNQCFFVVVDLERLFDWHSDHVVFIFVGFGSVGEAVHIDRLVIYKADSFTREHNRCFEVMFLVVLNNIVEVVANYFSRLVS